MAETRRPVPKIGVDMLYVAPVTKDDETGTTYGTAVRLPGLNNIGYDPSTQSATYDADDGTYVSFAADGTTTVTVKVADLLSEHYAMLLGLEQTAEGVVEEGTADSPPEMALGWRSQKSDGSYRFVWVLKGKFAKSAETYATKSGSGVTYNDRELTYTALNRIADGKKRRQLDSDDPKLPAGTTLAALSDPDTGWFSSPDFEPAGG
ncbi:MAG: major tail protein [Christensenellaceae bacterium]|jgi:phi13 family phage major tail protein